MLYCTTVYYIVLFFTFFLQASLTYTEAQLIIDDPSREDNIALSLRSLNSLAKTLKKRRIDDG